MPDEYGNPTEAERRGQRSTVTPYNPSEAERARIAADIITRNAGNAEQSMYLNNQWYSGDEYRTSTDPTIVAHREQSLQRGALAPNVLFGEKGNGRVQSPEEKRYRQDYYDKYTQLMNHGFWSKPEYVLPAFILAAAGGAAAMGGLGGAGGGGAGAAAPAGEGAVGWGGAGTGGFEGMASLPNMSAVGGGNAGAYAAAGGPAGGAGMGAGGYGTAANSSGSAMGWQDYADLAQSFGGMGGGGEQQGSPDDEYRYKPSNPAYLQQSVTGGAPVTYSTLLARKLMRG